MYCLNSYIFEIPENAKVDKIKKSLPKKNKWVGVNKKVPASFKFKK